MMMSDLELGEDEALIVSDTNFSGLVGFCKKCNNSVADYLCNATVIKERPEASTWDFWLSCTNPDCENHYGEGYLQSEPEWFERTKTLEL
jgi:hypothetical protein